MNHVLQAPLLVDWQAGSSLNINIWKREAQFGLKLTAIPKPKTTVKRRLGYNGACSPTQNGPRNPPQAKCSRHSLSSRAVDVAVQSSQSNITHIDDFSQIGAETRQLRDSQGLILNVPQREQAVIVGAEWKSDPGLLPLEESLAELTLLADTAGIDVLDSLTQNLETPNPASFIGSGKVQELVQRVTALRAQVVIFDIELSPRQQRVLEQELGQEVKVIDRTALVLDIFAKHARTREGIVQVELAQYAYRLPRLTRAWTHLARQAGGGAGGNGGGVGLRGPGETQLEVDRRQIARRIDKLNAELQSIRSHRQRNKARRNQDMTPRLGLVGYTNAGKSTLLNRLTAARALADDQLFATLDPITRSLELESGLQAYITDTVGFIQKLPTAVVAAFRATLETVNDSHLLLHVVDASHQSAEEHLTVVEEVLDTLGAGNIPSVLVLNKTDLLAPGSDLTNRIRETSLEHYLAVMPISAQSGEGVPALRSVLSQALYARMDAVSVVIPYARGDLVSKVHQYGQIDAETYQENGTRIEGRVPHHLSPLLHDFTVN